VVDRVAAERLEPLDGLPVRLDDVLAGRPPRLEAAHLGLQVVEPAEAAAQEGVDALVRLDRDVLRQVADVRARPDRDLAAVRRERAGDDPEQGRLADAGLADQADARAGAQDERGAVEHQLGAVPLAD
jgi:hypothetical protein